MGKKLEALAGSLVDNELALKVRESANQLWLAGLGAYSITQAEGEKAFNALVKDGEIVQARTRKVADKTIASVTGKAVDTWGRIEHVVEDGIARSLGRLGVPTKRDINKLSRSVVELSAVVHKLAEEKAKPAQNA
ncbi:MAG: phasin family protein [Propionivibrio sp.]|nr:phasin family protein [Propionivibrio sp.]